MHFLANLRATRQPHLFSVRMVDSLQYKVDYPQLWWINPNKNTKKGRGASPHPKLSLTETM